MKVFTHGTAFGNTALGDQLHAVSSLLDIKWKRISISNSDIVNESKAIDIYLLHPDNTLWHTTSARQGADAPNEPSLSVVQDVKDLYPNGIVLLNDGTLLYLQEEISTVIDSDVTEVLSVQYYGSDASVYYNKAVGNSIRANRARGTTTFTFLTGRDRFIEMKYTYVKSADGTWGNFTTETALSFNPDDFDEIIYSNWWSSSLDRVQAVFLYIKDNNIYSNATGTIFGKGVEAPEGASRLIAWSSALQNRFTSNLSNELDTRVTIVSLLWDNNILQEITPSSGSSLSSYTVKTYNLGDIEDKINMISIPMYRNTTSINYITRGQIFLLNEITFDVEIVDEAGTVIDTLRIGGEQYLRSYVEDGKIYVEFTSPDQTVNSVEVPYRPRYGMELIGLRDIMTQLVYKADEWVELNVDRNISLQVVYGYPDQILINLYRNKAERNRIDKTNFLEHVGDVEGVFRESVNISTPTLSIYLPTFPNFNYLFIPSFERYYFVTDIVNVNKDLYNIVLEVDPLFSFKNEIYKCVGEVVRSSIVEKQNPLLIDSSLPLKNKNEIFEYEATESPFNTDATEWKNNFNYVINVLRGVKLQPTNEFDVWKEE